MSYRIRRPEIIPTILVICVAALMFKLGYWQIERLHWKNELLTSIDEAQSAPPRDIVSYPPEALPGAQWHNVVAGGTLLNDKEMYATPRYLKGQMGYAILTPLAINTVEGVEYVLVNRGWVPPEKKDPATRRPGNTMQAVKIEGVIRSGFKQEMFRPDNVPAKNLWFWYDLPAMAQYEHLPLLPVMIDATNITFADGTPILGGPVPFPLEVNIRNDHLGYAITWFLIGIAAIVMYVIYYAEKKDKPLPEIKEKEKTT